jgi:hypothetical protein
MFAKLFTTVAATAVIAAVLTLNFSLSHAGRASLNPVTPTMVAVDNNDVCTNDPPPPPPRPAVVAAVRG